jgi:hypothetical protein
LEEALVACSTNPRERVNKEIKCRTVSPGCPYPASLFRLAGAMLFKIHDEWQVTDRHCLSESSAALRTQQAEKPIPTDSSVADSADRVIVNRHRNPDDTQATIYSTRRDPAGDAHAILRLPDRRRAATENERSLAAGGGFAPMGTPIA